MTAMPQGEVVVWWSPLDGLQPVHLSLLDDAEHERLGRFRQPSDRCRFALGATLLRLAVSHLRQIPPATVSVDRRCDICGQQHGRPVVAGGPHVSVSHSHDVVAVACAGAAPVGVDVEVIQGDRTASDFLDMVVSPRDAIAATAHRALVTWTMKEAYLKAVGTGLRTPPNAVALAGDETCARVIDAPDGLPVPAWVSGVSVRPGYLGAVCVLGHQPVRVVVQCRCHAGAE